MIVATFPITPIAKGRPRMTFGRCYTPAQTRKFENAIKVLARVYAPETPYTGPLRVEITFNLPRPKTSRRLYPSVKPDLDNLQKAILDALNGIFWQDDSQICEIAAKKIYDTTSQAKGSIDLNVLPLSTEAVKKPRGMKAVVDAMLSEDVIK